MEQSTQRTFTLSMNFNSHEVVSLLYEVNLGQHALLLMSDGSITLLASGEQMPSLVDDRLSLDPDETYRLFISLHEQFKQDRADEAETSEPVSSYEPLDALEALQERIEHETPWIVHSLSQSLLAVKDARLGNLCTAFGSEVDYEQYCSLFHRRNQGGCHGS